MDSQDLVCTATVQATVHMYGVITITCSSTLCAGGSYDRCSTGHGEPGRLGSVPQGGAAYVSGKGHFAYSHADWSCMAAPIYHPSGGDLLGVLDLSGPRAQLGRDVIGMVRMTALLAEEMLRIATPPAQGSAETVRLRLLGAQPAVRIGCGPWRKLSLRLAEILAVLSSRARGFTSTELACELYGDGGRPGTVRAEMYRLRKRLGPIICSEPHRFAEGLRTVSDVHGVEDALARGGR